MKQHVFEIAGFRVGLWLPGEWDADGLLPSFRPFRCKGTEREKLIMEMRINGDEPSDSFPQGELIEDMENDMGHVRLYVLPEGYRVDISSPWGKEAHTMIADRCFVRTEVKLCDMEPDKGYVLTSLLRIAFSQAILREKAVSVHASAVYGNGKAYLFMGKSGTGKSTHSALWINTFDGFDLLNDDNPVIRMQQGKAWAYGTPWSGKTPCYKNLGVPVEGIVRLKQALVNRFLPQNGTNAFILLLPACSVIRIDSYLSGLVCDMLAQMSEITPIGLLECLPNKEAVLLCRKGIENIEIEKN